jgi:polyhydroxyalkanoic acid synthase PhaR subunit
MTKRENTEAPGGTPPSDPFDAWRKMFEANEATWSTTAKDSVGSEAWAKAQSRMLETILGFQKSASDAMGASLAAMNLPSRSDVARLGELILSLEEKIDQLDDRLGNLERPVVASKTTSAPAGRAARSAKRAKPARR